MAAKSAPDNWIVPIGALLVATFAICTSELVIAGLLPALATDLAVSIPTAGQLITGYAIGVGALGPILSLLTGRVPRKILLLGIMAVYIVGNVLCALATNYWTLMGARMVLAACHGLHFGVAIVVGDPVGPGRPASLRPFAVLMVLTALLSKLSANGWLSAMLLFLIWVGGFAVVSSLQSRLQREVSDAPNFASTLMNTASQVGVAAGAALGGLVITWGWGYGQIPLLSAGFAALSVAGTLLLVTSDHRRKPALA